MGEWSGGIKPECPAIKELKAALLSAVPILANDPAKLGTVRNDASRHTAGLAMDIMLDSRDHIEKSVGDQIVDAVIKVHSQMKWYDLIYTDWVNGKPFYFHVPGLPPYGGPKGLLKKNPTSVKLGKQHENHIHIDWFAFNATKWPSQASTTGFQTALIAELQRPPKWLSDYMSQFP
jgi:hypothetical protein